MDKAVYGVFLCLYIVFPISKGCGTYYSPTTYSLDPRHSINITTPNYPNNYPPNVVCYWLVQTTPDSKLHYRFSGTFQLQLGDQCQYDSVTLHDSSDGTNYIRSYCGSYRPNPGYTTGRYLFVSYRSDGNETFAGFNLEVASKQDECGSTDSPTLYLLDHGKTVEITSPNFPDHYPRNKTCHWLLQTAPDSKFKYRFQIGFPRRCQFDNVQLYDSSNTTNLIGTYCGVSRANLGTTTGSYLYVSYISDGSSASAEFKLEITSIPHGCGTSDSPIAISLGRGEKLNITSPNYPDIYPNDKTCYWFVQTAPGSKLKYRFVGEFQLESECSFDHVTLYDSVNTSNVIGTYCGSSRPNPGNTTGRYLFVTFKSDGSSSFAGFNIEITSTKNDSIGEFTAAPNSSLPTMSNNGSYTVPTNKSECGSYNSPITYILDTDHTLNISSPNYPLYYPDNEMCYWLVRTTPDNKLKYRFIGQFQLESGCPYDNVKLFDSWNTSNIIGTYCGSSRPNPGTTTGSYLFVIFKSDGSSSFAGFKLEITSKEYECGTSDSPTMYVLDTRQTINISSPNFPYDPKNKTCHWLLQTAPDSKLTYRFIGQFQLGTHRRCVYDNVRLYDSSNTSNIIGSYCGLSHYNISTTTGRYLYVSFTSDGNETSTGFKLEISSTQNASGSTESPITYVLNRGDTLVITSPKYPDNYPDNVKFHWLVQTSPGSILQYRFNGQFHLESHDQCQYDNVTLYDSSFTTNVIGSYCGSSRPNPGTTTGSYLYISFKSDISSTFAGFNLEITSTNNASNGGLTGVTNSSWLNTTYGVSNNTVPTNVSGTSQGCGTYDSPITYALDPGHKVNITSPNYPRDYPNNANCYWLVRTTPDNKLQYRFIGQFQLESGCQYDNVKLHDSSHTSNIIGSYCGSYRPDPGNTTGRYLFVSFKSDASGTFAGFNLEITSKRDDFNGGLTGVTNSSWLNTTYGVSNNTVPTNVSGTLSTCGTSRSPITYALGPGYNRVNITSPNYPRDYPNNVNCYWLVRTSPDNKLKYRFIGHFQLESGCQYDNVTLYDSSNTTNVIGSYCGSFRPNPGTTTGRYLYVSFKSDGTTKFAGFNIEITSKEDECGTLDSPTTHILGYGRTLNISSPDFPNNYLKNKTCHWLVKAAPGTNLTYRFIGQFQLGTHRRCVYDNVKLYDSSNTSNIIGSYCGLSQYNTNTTTGSYLFISYTNDGNETSTGFKLEISSKQDGSVSADTPITYILEPGHTLNISSPNYPDNYPDNVKVHWLVQTSPNSILKYRFIGQFQFENECLYDNVTLYDSSNATKYMGSYCGSYRPNPGATTGRYLYVRFSSDKSTTFAGFSLEITSTNDACGTSDSPTIYVLGPGRTINITSPNYPFDYPNNKACYWLVQAAQDFIVKYRFIGQFQLESRCSYDSVTLYDSSNTTNVIGSFCGSTPPNPGTTTGRYLFVIFKSDGGSSYAGFNLEITSKKDECGTSNSPTTYVLGPGQNVTITSPNYPYDYPNNVICHWLVRTAPESKIRYRFIGSVEVQGGDQCQYDSVTLYDSSNTTNFIGTYCGSSRPNPGTTAGSYLFVIFKSDGRAVQTGFNLEILSKDYACGTSDSPTKYLLGRGQTLNITSPHYPRNYPSEEECHWLVETTPGSKLKYSFIGEFELESGGTKCRLDSVTLYDSSTTTNLIGTYCWYRPYPGITTGRFLFISFKSDRGTTSAGFNLGIASKYTDD